MRLFCIFISFLLIGCDFSDGFPKSIDDKKTTKPVEKVESFIEKRFEKLDKYSRNFKLYYIAVINKKEINSRWFKTSEYALSEIEKPTKTIVNEFVRSPAGAYLSEQDRIYIRRLLTEKLENLESDLDNIKKIKRPDKEERDIDYSYSEIQSIFLNISNAKKDIDAISQENIDRITALLKKELMANNPELWRAIKSQDIKEIDSLTEEFSYDSIVRPIILSVLFDTEDKWSLSDREKIVFDVINQAYTAYPYGYIKVVLQEKLVNDFLGKKSLAKLNDKVMVSLAR